MNQKHTPNSLAGYARAAVELLRNRGPRALLLRGTELGYNHVLRPLLPVRERPNMPTMEVARAPYRLGDGSVPWTPPSKFPPEQEQGLRKGLTYTVTEGDDVVIVGGGAGISTTVAAKLAGETGTVTVFEATEKNCCAVEQTAVENDIADRVTVTHAVVAEYTDHARESYGPVGSAPVIPIKDLPAADVLELDCEGTEIKILRSLDTLPPVAVVETHGYLGYPTEKTASLLKERGYKILARYSENESLGVDVMVAER